MGKYLTYKRMMLINSTAYKIVIYIGFILSYDLVWWSYWTNSYITILPLIGSVLLAIEFLPLKKQKINNRIWSIYFVIILLMIIIYLCFWVIHEMAGGFFRIPIIEELWEASYNTETAVLSREFNWFRLLVYMLFWGVYISHLLMGTVFIIAVTNDVVTIKKNYWFYLLSIPAGIIFLFSKLYYCIEQLLYIYYVQKSFYGSYVLNIWFNNRILIKVFVYFSGIIVLLMLAAYNCKQQDK